MALADDLARTAGAAADYGPSDTPVAAVIAAEPSAGVRAYVCAFSAGDESPRSWLVLDDSGVPVTGRRDVKDAVSIAALCEIAEESATGGDLDALLAELVALRLTAAPDGVEGAEAAARALQHVLGAPPQLASPQRLDEIGAATRRLELALDPTAGSPFTVAMKGAQGVVDELLREVEATYRVALA